MIYLPLPPALVAPAPTTTAQKITSPKDFFGFEIGADYRLATYTQFAAYWHKLDSESNRMTLEEMGKTAEGRPQLMAIITSPANHKRLARYREIAGRLAKAEGLTESEAKKLATEGKAVVWIDGGLHANEVLGSHQLIETAYRLVSSNDPEVKRFLDDCIILVVHANPDGMELVSESYMSNPVETQRKIDLPRLYQKYIGHDNNRDFYMATQAETQNMLKVQYEQWFPQIIYNHHQTGPPGSVLFAPPFRAPHNHHFDPLVVTGIDLVGTSMHNRFVLENKPGAVRRDQASYQTWWNGGLRTTAYFHNIIGLLTESIGSPTPLQIPFVPDKLVPQENYILPITPQTWHFRQSIEYSVTANYAVLDIASRHREQFLFNIYKMGRNSIEKGSRDTWTDYPRRIAAVKKSTRPSFDALRTPELRDPRGYILPADQPDFPTAVKFVNTLRRNGITVEQATQAFTVAGKTYPANSLVVRTAQAFRPHIMDMFEPQDYPNDLKYPGGPPIPPYDSAGYTLAFQMGIQFDRVLDAFDAPTKPIAGLAQPVPGTVSAGAAGWLVRHAYNDAFVVLNRVLKAGGEAHWVLDGPQQGAWFIARSTATVPLVEKAAKELGLDFSGVDAPPTGTLHRLKPLRIALWDRYGGSMESGWTRWLFEQFEFPFTVVPSKDIEAGGLTGKFDAVVLVDGAIRGRDSSLTPALKTFLEGGGTVATIGSSTALAQQLGLPVKSHLIERTTGRALSSDQFFVPGSVLQVTTDNTQPLAHGLPPKLDVFFDNSPVFELAPGGPVRPLAWFDSESPLRSGWAWGQSYLKGGVAIAEAPVGKGHLYLFGPEILNRAQPHGTFKYLFNGLYAP